MKKIVSLSRFVLFVFFIHIFLLYFFPTITRFYLFAHFSRSSWHKDVDDLPSQARQLAANRLIRKEAIIQGSHFLLLISRLSAGSVTVIVCLFVFKPIIRVGEKKESAQIILLLFFLRVGKDVLYFALMMTKFRFLLF